MSIAQVEDHLVETIRARFTRADGRCALRNVASLPSDWDGETFRRLLRTVPGAFVVWGGGRALEGSTDIDSQWVVVAVTGHASGELARRRGDRVEIGAYDIIETVVALLHEHPVPNESRLQFEEIENLFTGEIEKQGAAIYAATFSLRMRVVAPDDGGVDRLHNFLTFHADTDLAPPDGRPEASDTVELPPPPEPAT